MTLKSYDVAVLLVLKISPIFHSGIIPDVEELGEGASPARTTQHSGGYRWQQMWYLRCQVNSTVLCHKRLHILSSLFSLKGCTRGGCQLNLTSGKDLHICCQLVSTHWIQAHTRTVTISITCDEKEIHSSAVCNLSFHFKLLHSSHRSNDMSWFTIAFFGSVSRLSVWLYFTFRNHKDRDIESEK